MSRITTRSAKEGWLALLVDISERGTTYTDQEGRVCREVRNKLLTVEEPTDTLEVVREMQRRDEWVYPSPEELRSIVLGSRAHGAREYSYAPRLFTDPNQVDSFIIPLLKENPLSRRAVAILYHPEIDSKTTSSMIPGLLSVHFRSGPSLELTCHMRSTDVFIGLPATLYQMRCLQEYVAEKLGVPAGAIHVFSTSAHFFAEYEEAFAQMTKGINKARRSTDA